MIEERALVHDSMDATKVQRIREDMERIEARKLQPHFIAAFFMEAFRLLGGTVREREPKRYEITNVPAVIRSRDRLIGRRQSLRLKYERITFEKELINLQGKPSAEFICPGHPLLDTVIDLVLERHRDLLKQGAILIDESDPGTEIRALIYLEHSIQDASIDRDGNRRLISRQFHFVQVDAQGHLQNAGFAPYLDYRPANQEEQEVFARQSYPDWITKSLESSALDYTIAHIVPEHLQSVRVRKEALANKALGEVNRRLTTEINYWDYRAQQLKEDELAGKTNARLNSGKARQRADELSARLKKRTEELQQEKQISPLPPNVLGAALIIPAGLLYQLQGQTPQVLTQNTAEVEQIAMNAVMEIERTLGFEPKDVSADKCGYDIESRIPQNPGKLRFVEVKGCRMDADTVTITKNEILTGLNKPDDYILAIVQVDGDKKIPYYIRRPFNIEPDFGVTSVNYKVAELIAKAKTPN